MEPDFPSASSSGSRLRRESRRLGLQRNPALADALENCVVKLLPRDAGRQACGGVFKEPMVTGQPLVAVPRFALFTLVKSLDQPLEVMMQEKPPRESCPLRRCLRDDETSAICCAALLVKPSRSPPLSRRRILDAWLQTRTPGQRTSAARLPYGAALTLRPLDLQLTDARFPID